jgi:hypothetical protein
LALIGLFIWNREDREDRKEYFLAHLAAEQSGRSIGFLINWKIPRTKDGIQRMIWRER